MLSFNMLFGADTKELFPVKMLAGAGMEKTPLNQYVRCSCHENAQFIENARRDWYRISFFYSVR